MRYITLLLSSALFVSGVSLAADPAPTPAPAADLTRKEAVEAINFYQGQLANQSQNREDHFMMQGAPGTTRTIDAGENLAKILNNRPTVIANAMNDELRRTVSETGKSGPAKTLQAHQPFSGNNKDLNVATLLGSSKIDAEDKAAAKVLMQMIAYPIPEVIDPGALTARAGGTLKEGDFNTMARGLGESAVLAAAYHSMYEMYAKRDVDPAVGKSQMQIIEEECTWRLFDAGQDWFAEIAVTPSEGLLREMIHMEAMRLYMEFERYKQMERIEVLLGGGLGSNMVGAREMKKLGSMMDALKGQVASSSAQVSQATEKASEDMKEQAKAAKDVKK